MEWPCLDRAWSLSTLINTWGFIRASLSCFPPQCTLPSSPERGYTTHCFPLPSSAALGSLLFFPFLPVPSGAPKGTRQAQAPQLGL